MHGGGNRIYGRHMSYVTDSLQKAKSLKIFKDFVVQGQGQGLVNWSSRILEDKDFLRGVLQHCFVPYTRSTTRYGLHLYFVSILAVCVAVSQ